MGDFKMHVMASQEYGFEIMRECLQAGKWHFLTLTVAHDLPNVPWNFLA